MAEVIEPLDTMPVSDRPADLHASVQPNAVVLTDAQDRQVILPLPADEVYVSVAPYRNQTHDCYFHNLTTCLGELDNTDVQVTLTSSDDQVLVDETRRTYDNGFFGLWVPRDIDASLKISHAGQAQPPRFPPVVRMTRPVSLPCSSFEGSTALDGA